MHFTQFHQLSLTKPIKMHCFICTKTTGEPVKMPIGLALLGFWDTVNKSEDYVGHLNEGIPMLAKR